MNKPGGQNPHHPSPPSMMDVFGTTTTSSATSTSLDRTETVTSFDSLDSTTMTSTLAPPATRDVFSQVPDSSPVANGAPLVVHSKQEGEYSTKAPPDAIGCYNSGLTEQAAPVAVIAPQALSNPAVVVPVTNNQNTAAPAYNDNNETTTATDRDVMQPQQFVSALGSSVVRVDEVEGGKQNAFMKSAPPAGAFLSVSSSTSPSLSGDAEGLRNDDIATSPSSVDHHESQEPTVSPRGLPLGVPDPDDYNPRDTQHSLPNVEELKAERGTWSTQDFFLGHPYVPFVIIFGSVFLVILGLSIGLTQDTRNERKQVTFHGGDLRLYHIQEFLTVNGISDTSSFKHFQSPQYQAADWMAHDDKLELGIPKLAPSKNDESYDFVTRYVMALLYYATKGKSWQHDMNFLSNKVTCDWYQVFAPPVGQLGVLCNRNTNKIVGFSFSTWDGLKNHIF
jgi:hypothetical protein